MEDHSLGPGATRGARAARSASPSPRPGTEVTSAILGVGGQVRLGARDRRQRVRRRADRLHPVDDQGRPPHHLLRRVRPAGAGPTAAARRRRQRSPSPPAPASAACSSTAVVSPASGCGRQPGRNVRDVTARREVIVCAGAVETPLLLERSGIGRPDVLSAAGIEPRIESPNVGERVIEQRGIALQVTLDQGQVAASRLSTRRGQAAEVLRYLRSGQGLLVDRRLRPGLPVQVGAGPAPPRRPGPVRPDGARHREQAT